LLNDVQKADALSGARSQSFMNQAAARGVQSAGETGGGAGLAMFGAGMGAAGGMVNPAQPWSPPGQQGGQQQGAPQQGGQQQAPQQGEGQQQAAPQQAAPAQEDPVAKLAQYKQMLEQGLISEEDYEAAKKAALGL
ncbi:MAG: SHOCT domain-containing protein, partial [Brachybacterium tyrofermentans]